MVISPYIRDLEGQLIEVIDLDQAIRQTAIYIGVLYNQQDPSVQEFAKKRQRYWKDIFQKLGRMKNKRDAAQLKKVSTDGFPSKQEQL